MTKSKSKVNTQPSTKLQAKAKPLIKIAVETTAGILVELKSS